jgi:ABC-type Fe3+/spermidine/putrescine transport system ATPase subunit
MGTLSSSSDGAAIELAGVSRRYGGIRALEAIDLRIDRGEFFSLLGPSGCGKTTSLRIIGGFEQPDRGRVWLAGIDHTEVPPHRRPVNTVFQSYALFPHLCVWDNVAFGPRSHRLAEAEIRRRVGEMLEIVGLQDLAQRRPGQLSGGQQQRVALARALVNTPVALLLDEPLAALDPTMRRSMQAELKRIQREVGVTFLMVSHDQQEALALSDRLAVLRDGRIEQVGTPRQLYDRPASRFVAGFVGEANLIPLPQGGLGLLRPEWLTLSPEAPPPGRSGRRGQVAEISFEGASLRVRLDCGDGQELLVRQYSHDAALELRSGADLWAHWDPAAVHPLP